MTKVVGISMVKDEADVIEGTLRHMASEVDALLVADNGSTDGTTSLMFDLIGELNLVVTPDPDPAYRQSDKMTALAAKAAELFGGDIWIVPFDADELWCADGVPIRVLLPEVPVPVATARLTNHLRTGCDLNDPDPFRSMVWTQPEPQELPKVAFRYAPGARIHQGNHGVSLPGLASTAEVLQVRHFPVRSAAQLIRKARNGGAAYRAAPELPEDMGAHWRSWDRLDDRQLHASFHLNWSYPDPEAAGLINNPAPYRRWEQQ